MGFNMHTGKRNRLQLPEDEQYDRLSTQLICGKLIQPQNKFLFPALNSSNNIAAMKLMLLSKILVKKYSCNNVFKSMLKFMLKSILVTTFLNQC